MNTYVNLKECNDVYILDEFKNIDLVSVKDLLNKISELAAEIEELQESLYEVKKDYEDLEEDLESNYKPIPLKELYGIDDKDFI